MDADLELLKSTLNSLVVSSPSQMDMRTLMKDYRNMIGSDIPIAKHGYRDMPTFLKERCSDCFVLSGPLRNPVLTLVVKESLKHIDSFVQKQKSANINKWLGKRRSIPAAAIAPTPNNRNDTPKFRPTSNNNSSYVQRSEPVKKSVNNLPLTIKEKSQPIEISTNKVRNTAPSPSPPQRIQSREESDDISNKLAVQNFFKKRMPSECLDPDFWVTDKDSAKSQDDDSGRITSSSGGSSSRKLLREELSQEIRALVAEYPEGISSIDFTTLYRCRYGRDVPYQAWGCTSVLAAVRLAGGARVWRSPHAPDWTLLPEGAAAPSSLSPAHLPQFPPRSLTHSKEVIDPDDALPGMDFDPSVFPDDCIHYVESIAQESVSGLQPGDTVPVCVGEVYSPSHMWLLRLGPDHDVAMETIMDEMTQYYSSGEGRDRALCLGAARVGHYCAALFEQDWHRAVIVRVIDADTFKVRHIDYGTVARVSLYQLKPLLRRWCELPAQALRARLADVRTTARGTWPLPASLRLLDLVKEKRLVASVVTVHEEENAIDIILVDTSGEDDVVIGHQLVQSGHAVPALSPSSPRQTSEAHLFPRFEALEGGATPNLGELLQLARLGIDPAYVDTYRRHVPGPAHPLVLAGSEHSDSDRDSDALPDADSDTIPDETTKEQKLVELHSETEEKNEPQKDSSADSMPRKEPPQEIPQVYPSMPNLHFMGAAPPLPPPPYFPPYFVPRPMPIPFPPYGNFHDFPPPVPPFGPGPFPPYAHPPPPPVCPPPPPVCPPPPAPPGQGEGPLALRRIDVEVFRRLATVDTRTAASHMSDALSRAAAAAAQSRADDVAVARVDAAVFTRLIELDGDMAVRHMQATLERAVPSSRLNPEAEEFRLVNSETQTEPPPANPAPSPAVSRSQLSLLGGIAPPPGFENYTPRI